MARSRWPAGVACAVLMFVTAACGTSDEGHESQTPPASQSEASTQSAAGPDLMIENDTFTDLTVPSGAQITVKNMDSAEHSVTSNTPGIFDLHVEGNQQAVLTAPTQPGTYPFHCTYHPDMRGVLTVL